MEGTSVDVTDPVVNIDAFSAWADSGPTLPFESATKPTESKFPLKKRVNQKLYTWVGPIWKVGVDAIVNTTSENFAERGGVSGGIFKAAGPGLEKECSTLEGCRTGEAKMTAAYKLPCKSVIHTVGPKYNLKYRTAAENALHHCYFHCLEEMVEAGHRSIAFCCVNTEKKSYPPEDAAHIIVRTVRRFLERYGNKVDAICFTFANATERRAYDVVLPLYFPRTKAEQYRAVSLLPEDVGNESGETVVAERQVRVGESYKNSGNSGGISATTLGAPTGYEHDEWLEPELDPTKPAGAAAAAEADQYYHLLQEAKAKQLGDIKRRNIVYRAGKDARGLPVFVFVTRHIELDQIDLHDLLLYMIRVMDGDVTSPEGYTMILVYSEATENNIPATSWVKEVYDSLPRKYKKHMKSMHVIHPSFLMKCATWFLKTFVSAKFWSKVITHDDLETLRDHVAEAEAQLPDWVDETNRKIFNRPPKPPAANTSKGKKKKSAVQSSDGL